jgi:hypothetical protein
MPADTTGTSLISSHNFNNHTKEENMEAVKELFATAPFIAWSLVSVVLAMVVIALNWPTVRWWWHNTWYSFPIIGKISGLSKDSNKDPVDTTWFKAEKALCRDYKQFIRIQDEHDFNEKITYLTKAGDIGRKGTPKLIWALTVALVFVEAMGFSYVLAGYTLPGASENLQQTGAYGIAFLLAVILVAFTHFSGHELYKSGKIANARQEWSEGGRKGKTTSGTVALAKPQSVDDEQPGYVQLMNRVGTKPTYYATVGTVIFVVIVAFFATYVRGQVLEKQLQQQITGQSNGSPVNVSVSVGNDGLNMSSSQSGNNITLPADDAAANKNAEQKAIADEVNIDRHGGWGTFIVLAFIFIFLQILGVFFGFRWGFAGQQSEDAFNAIGAGRYSSYADVREHYKDIADAAQSKLEHLQQKMMKENGTSGNDGLHTFQNFYVFMDGERNREASERHRELERTAQRGRMENTPAVPAPSINPVQAAATSSNVSSLSDAMQKLQSLGDNKDAKKAYIQGLPAKLQAEVMQALKSRKEEAERLVSQRDAELDGLL